MPVPPPSPSRPNQFSRGQVWACTYRFAIALSFLLFIVRRRNSPQQVGRENPVHRSLCGKAYRGALPHLFSRWGRRHVAMKTSCHEVMAKVTEMLTTPGVLCLGWLNLLNNSSNSHTLPCSRAALEASYLCSAGMSLYSAACSLSLQKYMAETATFVSDFRFKCQGIGGVVPYQQKCL